MILRRKVHDISIVHADHVGVAEGEFDVEGDECVDALFGRGPVGRDAGSSGDEIVAHLDQHGAEQCLLSGEVTVDRRAGYAHGGADVLEAHPVVPALGEEPGRLSEDRVRPLCLRAISRSRGLVISVNPR